MTLLEFTASALHFALLQDGFKSSLSYLIILPLSLNQRLMSYLIATLSALRLSEKEVVLSNLPSEPDEIKPLSLDCCIKTALVVAISLFHSQNQLLGIPKKEANFSPQYMATMLLHYACTMFREGNIKSLQERIMSDSSLLIGSKTLHTAACMYHKLYPSDNASREDGSLATPGEDFIFSQGRVYVPLKSFAQKKGARHKLDYLDKAVNFIPPDMAGTIEALFAQEEKPTHRHSHFN